MSTPYPSSETISRMASPLYHPDGLAIYPECFGYSVEYDDGRPSEFSGAAFFRVLSTTFRSQLRYTRTVRVLEGKPYIHNKLEVLA